MAPVVKKLVLEKTLRALQIDEKQKKGYLNIDYGNMNSVYLVWIQTGIILDGLPQG